MKPSVASVALRSTNLRAVSFSSSWVAPSSGGVRPVSVESEVDALTRSALA